MNDSEFLTLSDQALTRIETALEALGDVDCSTVSEGVLEVEFDDGGKVIVNRHGAAKEIWVAARCGGFHFRWDGKEWVDTRDGRDILSVLSEIISRQAGRELRLS